MKKFIFLLILMCIPNEIMNAQANSTSKIIFDQAGLTLAEVNAYTFKYYPDNSLVGLSLTAACTGTVSPFTCSGQFPTFTNGNHTLTLSATSLGGESPKSAPFAFAYVGAPLSPGNIRIG